MDATLYRRPGPRQSAVLSFEVANTGSVSAHFEGCPDPMPVTLEGHSSAGWREDGSVNIRCVAILMWRRMELRSGLGYRYSVRLDRPGRYRFRIHFGDSPSNPYRHSAVGAPFDVQ